MDKTILQQDEGKFVRLVYYQTTHTASEDTDDDRKTASIKGVLQLSGNSFRVTGDYSTASGLIENVVEVKRWNK